MLTRALNDACGIRAHAGRPPKCHLQQSGHTKNHTHTHTHGETKEQGPPQLSRLSMRPLALGRRFESCRGRSMEHWQKDAARKSTSNIAAKGGSLPRQRPHKAQDSSRGFFAGGACQVIVRLDPDAATAGRHQVYVKSSILIRYTSSRDCTSPVGNLPWNLRAALFICLFCRAPVV